MNAELQIALAKLVEAIIEWVPVAFGWLVVYLLFFRSK